MHSSLTSQNFMKKRLLLLLIILPLLNLCLASPVIAGDVTPEDYWGGTEGYDSVRQEIKLGEQDPREMVANIINIILGFLGIIALVIILYAGFTWMTAAGNEDQVGKAKKMMSAGIIGLIIILSAFGIAKFVVGALINATN